ncbi:MAG: T9SS type A sorting domain-containing protein [Saprospiraceae bacterium]
MKKLFFFLPAFLFPHFIFSQNELVLFNVWEGEVFKKSSNEFFCVNSTDFFVFDENIVTTNQVYAYSNSFFEHLNGIFHGRDTSVFISTVYGSDLLSFKLTKYDKGWNLVDEMYIDYAAKYGAELSDGTIVFNEEFGSAITIFDPIDEETLNVETGAEIRATHVTEGDSIIGVSNNGLFIFSAIGDTIAIFPSFNFEHIIPKKNAGWAGQKADSLFLLSPDFDLLETVYFSDAVTIDMEAGYDKVVLLTNDSTVHIFNDLLLFENNFKINSNNFPEPSNFELTENGLIVSNGTAFKKFQWDGTDLYTENNDIGVVGVELGDYILEEYTALTFPNYDTIFRLRYTNPVFTVHNYGETAIKSFGISTSFPAFYVGFYNYYEQYNGILNQFFSNVSIAPGEEKEVVWSNLGFYFRNPPNGEIYDQCFWTTRPNLRIDDNYGNDKYCYEMVVATKEQFENNIAVSVFPNPSNGVFKISVGEAQARNVEWILYDQFGREQYNLSINNWQHEYEVLVNYLPTGIYFWKIKSEGKILDNGRLIIQH